MEVNKHKADLDTQNSRKRQRIHKRTGIEELPDDILVAILSCMSIKDAVNTSVLCSRWRYLWKFITGKLEFHERDFATNEEFIALVNRDLIMYNRLDSLVIHFCNTRKISRNVVDEWISSAMFKQVKRFELDFSANCGFGSSYEFPGTAHLLTEFDDEWVNVLCNLRSVKGSLRYLNAFRSLRSLRLVYVDIKDEVVQYFLDSCPYIEQLCIRESNATKDLRVVDPLPNLKEFEISDCCNLQTLVISAKNLVSCTYQGREISLPFKKTQNCFELTLGGLFCKSFVYQPNEHSSYSAQLVKLVLNLQTEDVQRESLERTIVPPDFYQFQALKQLELNIVSQVGRSLLFFTSLIEASPNLHKFQIKIEYLMTRPSDFDREIKSMIPFPEVNQEEAKRFDHKNLKVVKMAGYCGCASEENFLVHLLKNSPSIQTVVMDTDCDYYSDHWNNHVVMYRLRENGKNLMTKAKREANSRMDNQALTRFNARKHAEKLRDTKLKVLKLHIVSQVSRRLLFFTSLIEASPNLHEFNIKIDYLMACPADHDDLVINSQF